MKAAPLLELSSLSASASDVDMLSVVDKASEEGGSDPEVFGFAFAFDFGFKFAVRVEARLESDLGRGKTGTHQEGGHARCHPNRYSLPTQAS